MADIFACESGVVADGSNQQDQQLKCPCEDFVRDTDPFPEGGGPTKTIGINCNFTVGANIPIKQLLKGTTMSPWVRIGFQKFCKATTQTGQTPICGAPECATNVLVRSDAATDETVITTGNISEPGVLIADNCKAVIKAFQYGWGAVDSGNKCRVTIVDEAGGSFATWVRERLTQNPDTDSNKDKGVYNMKVQFGWYVTGGEEGDECGQPTAPVSGVPAPPGFNSSNTICSQVLWFLPNDITATYQGNKFIYEIEGTDLLVRGQENTIQKVFGTDENKIHFKDAVKQLAAFSQPQFCVDFKQINPATGEDEELVFHVEPGSSDDPDADSANGPRGKWVTYSRGPLATVNEWLKGVLADGGIDGAGVGMTVNYDSTYDCKDLAALDEDQCICEDTDFHAPDRGRMVIWRNELPTCRANFTNLSLDSLLKGIYIVNGGACSPVYAFNPSIKWGFQWATAKIAGLHIPREGRNQNQGTGQAATGCNISGGSGAARVTTVPGTNTMVNIRDPMTFTQKAISLHMQANVLDRPIEAELRIQGDPSLHFITPVRGYGRCLGIVFINPYSLGGADNDNPNSVGCQNWDNIFNTTTEDSLTDKPACFSNCNDMLTNRGWFIKGVDHQIRDNNYITTVKLMLPVPGSDLLAGANAGGDPNGAIIKFAGAFASIVSGLATPFGFPLLLKGVGNLLSAKQETENAEDPCVEQFCNTGAALRNFKAIQEAP